MIRSTDASGLTYLYPANDAGVGRILEERGEFAKIESDLIISYMKTGPGGALVDVGANIGAIALPVAKVTGAPVLAIEAQRLMANILAANALNNRLLNIEVMHAAAGSARGLADFPQGRLSARDTHYGAVGPLHPQAGSMPTESVKVCTLDEVAPPDTRVVKIDVEGAEPEVLAGAGRLISETRPIWLMEAKAGPSTTHTMQTLLSADYRLFWFYVPFWTPSAPRPKPEQEVRGDMSFVALPPGVENTWGLLQIEGPDQPRPTTYAPFMHYLRRYGFK